MDVPKDIISIVDERRDFIEAHKKELIGIGILLGLLMIYSLYRFYRWWKTPSVGAVGPAPTTVIIQQQPPATSVKIQQRTAAPQVVRVQATKTQQQRAVAQPPVVAPQVVGVQAAKTQQQRTATSQPPVVGVQANKTQQQRTAAVAQPQKKTPPLTRVNNQKVVVNLPSAQGPVSTGFSPVFRPSVA